MSIQAVAWVLEESQSRGFARLVLISLANHADENGQCWPAQATIASEAGVSKSSVAAQVKKLVELAELVVLEPGTPRRSARYRLTLGRVQHVDSQRPAQTGPSVHSRAGQNHQEPSELIAPPESDALPRDVPHETSAEDPERARTVAERSEAGKALRATKRPRARTARDDLFDALVEAFGPASTPSRSAFYGRTVSELVAAGATPEKVRRACSAMRARGWEHPTPEALVKHWDALLEESRPANPASERFWEER